jgi:mevalonate kinase
MLKSSLFYAKILLFGEYGIINDSMGLSIPYNSFKGKLSMDNEVGPSTTESNRQLKNFLNYLKSDDQLKELVNVDQLENDIYNGLSFDSSIPQGYGVGSSGALVAAIYDQYASSKIETDKKKSILVLKEIFSKMEAYFHGKSSGLDPLICYLNLPLLINAEGDMDTVGLPQESASGKAAIFLISSGRPGKTQPMVNIFMDKMKEKGFRNMVKDEFTKYNDACIQSFLSKDISPLFDNVKKLSKLLLDNFSPMIPSTFHKLWKDGIESNSYYLKLCGSGGGGYCLGFTQDIDQAKKKLNKYELEVVFSF